MDFVKFLFSIARRITDGDIADVNNLENTAEKQVERYSEKSDKIHERLYAKAHKGWIFQLILIFASPMLTAYFMNLKTKILNSDQHDDFDEFDDFEDLD